MMNVFDLVELAQATPDIDSCRIWTGHRNKAYGDGYVHRVIYEYFYGPIPEGCDIHHECKQPLCFNPNHLHLVTKQQHYAMRKKTHCKFGHPFTKSNTYIHGGKRSCKICKNSYSSAYQKIHRDKYTEYTRNWIERHPEMRESRLSYMKKYHEERKING